MTSLDEKVAALKAQNNAKSNGKSVAPTPKKKTPKRVATRPNVEAEKAQAFAHAYVRNHCNASLAYKEAISDRCKDSTAQVNGHKWLRKPSVQNVLAPLLQALMEKNEVNTEFVLSRLLEQANASPLDYFYIDDRGQIGGLDTSAVNDAQRRNLRSVRVTENSFTDKSGNDHMTRTYWVTVVDQQKAIEMFAKYLQMFTPDEEKEDGKRTGDLIEAGVKRIRKYKDAGAWEKTYEGEFTEVESR